MLIKNTPPINEYSSAFSTFTIPKRLLNLFCRAFLIDLENIIKNKPDTAKNIS